LPIGQKLVGKKEPGSGRDRSLHCGYLSVMRGCVRVKGERGEKERASVGRGPRGQIGEEVYHATVTVNGVFKRSIVKRRKDKKKGAEELGRRRSGTCYV